VPPEAQALLGSSNTKELTMSFWNIFGNMAISDKGETITRMSETLSVSSSGVTYHQFGQTTFGSDCSSFTQVGDFSSDGSTRMGSYTTGLGAIFNDQEVRPNSGTSAFHFNKRLGMDDDAF
jgi:hypothetical protein